MGYRILAPTAPAPEVSEAEIEALRLRLTTGSLNDQRHALSCLIALDAQIALVNCLASEHPETVHLAAAGLWECWLNEAGPAARHRLEEGISLMGAGHFDVARTIFERLTGEFPNWAEARNKLATVLYLQGDPARSIEHCRWVVATKPDHFGAWNGLTICAIQREDWPLALDAVRESLRLQPHSVYNRQLQHLIEARLSAV